MCPAKGEGQQCIGVVGRAHPDAPHVGWGQSDGPEAVCKVQGGYARGLCRVRWWLEASSNLKQCGEAEFWWLGWAVGIEGLHVDNQGSLGLAFAFYKDLGIGESRVQGNNTGSEEGIQHGLD